VQKRQVPFSAVETLSRLTMCCTWHAYTESDNGVLLRGEVRARGREKIMLSASNCRGDGVSLIAHRGRLRDAVRR